MNDAIPVRRNSSTTDLVYTALGAVLIAVCSWISIPTTVPFTMQTFAVFFVLLTLGGKRGTLAVIVYVLLGAVGIPVFAQFASGIGVLLGSTGGYIVGFVFTGLIYWLAAGIFGKKRWVQIASLLLGTAVMYTFGTAWFLMVYARTGQAVGIGAALAWCVIPFIVPDLIKMALAFMIARRLGPVLKM